MCSALLPAEPSKRKAAATSHSLGRDPGFLSLGWAPATIQEQSWLEQLEEAAALALVILFCPLNKGIPGYHGITGFAIQQQFRSKSHSGLVSV